MEVNNERLNLASDLPIECIFQIASFLSAKDVLNLASTCKRLTSVLNTDDAWESKVLDWISKQDARSGILGSSAESVRDHLGLQTLRATYQALVLLKIWPYGLWYNADASKYSRYLPEGSLFKIIAIFSNRTGGTSFEFAYVEIDYSAGLHFLEPQNEWLWVHRDTFRCEILRKKGLFCSEVANVTFTENEPLEQILFNAENTITVGMLTFKRARILDTPQQKREPSDLPPPPPGLYYGHYASHGCEILQLECTEGTQYTALKLTGDRHVPACQISFRFDTSTGVHQAPYNSHRDDPFPTAEGPRPIFRVSSDDAFVVDMEERPVDVVFSNAQGQINMIPGTWNPEWVRATVVVYKYQDDDGSGGTVPSSESSKRAVFSLIFEDQGEDHRHIIDFFPVVLPPPRYFKIDFELNRIFTRCRETE